MKYATATSLDSWPQKTRRATKSGLTTYYAIGLFVSLCAFRGDSMSEFEYDVFLSHSAKDKDVVRDVAYRLKSDGGVARES